MQERLDAGNDSAGTGDVTTDYNLDLAGNRLAKTMAIDGTADEVVKSTYNVKDHLLTEDSTINANDATFTYDDNGSLVSTTRNGVTTHRLWDVRNKLVGVDVNGDGDSSDSGEASYAYDDAGNRIAITKDSVTRRFLVNPSNPTGYSQVLEELESGIVKVSYVLGRDVIAQDATTANADPQYLVYDAHGSTRRILDATGQPMAGQVYAYDAFGSAIDTKLASGATLDFDPAAVLTRLLYTGEWFDVPSGQYFLRARYYDASTGRFGSYDFGYEGEASDPQSLNKYAYTEGDPVNGIDPSGNMTLAELKVVMYQRIEQMRRRTQQLKRAAVKTYRLLVQTSVTANYMVGLVEAMEHIQKDWYTALAIVSSSRYQLEMLRKFQSIPDNKLTAQTLSRIGDIVGIVQGAGRLEANAKARGLNIPIKDNGFPNFRNYLYPRYSSVFIELKGNRPADFRASNRVRRQIAIGLTAANTPNGYVWHHHEVLGVMQLVESRTHPQGGGISHYGGAFYYNVLTNKNSYK